MDLSLRSLRNLMFVTLGVLIAYLNVRAEVEFMAGARLLARGDVESAFLKHVRAAAYFPAIYYVREAHAALNGVANFLPPRIALDVIDRALESDPLNGALLWYKMAQELRWGNLDNAKAALEKLERLGPAWKETKDARTLYDAVSQMIAAERRKVANGGLS